MNPQRLALDAANQAIEDLRDKPNTPLMYAAFGLLDAFIQQRAAMGLNTQPELLDARAELQRIIDRS